MRYAAYYVHAAAPPSAAAYSDPLIFGAALQLLIALVLSLLRRTIEP